MSPANGHGFPPRVLSLGFVLPNGDELTFLLDVESEMVTVRAAVTGGVSGDEHEVRQGVRHEARHEFGPFPLLTMAEIVSSFIKQVGAHQRASQPEPRPADRPSGGDGPPDPTDL